MKELTIDAKGQKLGRMAAHVASKLRGKDQTGFKRHQLPEIRVKVINASKLDISSKKLSEKLYIHYTGYPGGLRQKTMQELIDKKGYSEILRRAVYGMLPNNRLRSRAMKSLVITE